MARNPKIDYIRGLIIYRIVDHQVEYLLLKKQRENDWSPPKGKRDGEESEMETAERETEEETGLILGDYQLLNSDIYFEYRNCTGVLKKVKLWPAELKPKEHSCSEVIHLSREHEKFLWLRIDEAETIVKKQYKAALIKANTFVTNVNTTKV